MRLLLLVAGSRAGPRTCPIAPLPTHAPCAQNSGEGRHVIQARDRHVAKPPLGSAARENTKAIVVGRIATVSLPIHR
jgi:hypothetical protein